jgi:hypothetical protein
MGLGGGEGEAPMVAALPPPAMEGDTKEGESEEEDPGDCDDSAAGRDRPMDAPKLYPG